MLPVALARPLWWLRLRSLRFLTGLLTLALAFGVGASPVGPPTAAGRQFPIAAVTRSQTAAMAQPSSVTVGQEVELHSAAQPVGADEGADSSIARDHAFSADATGTEFEARAEAATDRPSEHTWRPSGQTHAWADGQRAPPQM